MGRRERQRGGCHRAPAHGARGRGACHIATYTVLADAGRPARGIAVAELGDGTRTIASTDDPELVASMTAHEWCGRPVSIDDSGRLRPA